jgi:prevent-host-death family protein
LTFFAKVVNITTLEILMEKAISAADANRRFSQLLRDVKTGQSYLVTSHGRPVARIAPVGERSVASNAKASLLRRLKSERVLTVGRWKRDELYE